MTADRLIEQKPPRFTAAEPVAVALGDHQLGRHRLRVTYRPPSYGATSGTVLVAGLARARSGAPYWLAMFYLAPDGSLLHDLGNSWAVDRGLAAAAVAFVKQYQGA